MVLCFIPCECVNCLRILPMAGRSVRKLTFKFKLLESIGLGFPVIAVIWGNLYDASDAQLIFY